MTAPLSTFGMRAPLSTMGEIVSWTPPKEITLSQLRQALADSGLDPERAKDMLPRNAFSRAAKTLEEGRVIRKLDEDPDTITFQFTQEFRSGGRYDYNYEAVLIVTKQYGNVVCTEIPELAQEAERLLNEQLELRKSSDISRLIQALFEDHQGDLVAIREQGGAYFVPAHHQELIDSIDKLMFAIGGKLRRFEISPDNGNTKQSVARL